MIAERILEPASKLATSRCQRRVRTSCSHTAAGIKDCALGRSGMVNDTQVRRLKKLSKTEKTHEVAAAKAGMDEKTARKYLRDGRLPSRSGQNSSASGILR
jgi:hypothetical protein